MSESFDRTRPGGYRPSDLPTPQERTGRPPYAGTSVLTGPPPPMAQDHTGDPLSGPPLGPPPYADPYRQSELVAPMRPSVPPKSTAPNPIVPAGSVTGRSLTLVIAIMCFLACLTAGAVYMINQSAAAWLKDVASEVSVQVEPKGSAQDNERRIGEISLFLAKQAGIKAVKPMSQKDSSALLEPWLGKSAGLAELPVPRIIALELDRNSPPEFDKLRTALIKQFPGTTLDDHRHWQAQIRTVTRSFALGGLAILMLVGAATTAIIISATKSAMASNREIVEVLHFVGATDRLIAREFEKHFLRLGIRAGLVGAGLAMAVFFAMPTAMRVLGGEAVTQAELSRLIGTGALDLPGYFLLGIVVVVTAALCMLTSRYGVYRILNSQH
jgi:cell division transport system permease protein